MHYRRYRGVILAEWMILEGTDKSTLQYFRSTKLLSLSARPIGQRVFGQDPKARR